MFMWIKNFSVVVYVFMELPYYDYHCTTINTFSFYLFNDCIFPVFGELQLVFH